MTFERFSVVVVPFPFADRAATRRRPAVVVSAPEAMGLVGHSILAMVTSAANPSWPVDVPISDLEAAGLTHASIVRMKLFTLDDRLVLRVAGKLAPADAERIEHAVRNALGGEKASDA